MTTLDALRLERALDLARSGRAASARPKLVYKWTIDPQSGRPVAVWTQEVAPVLPAILRETVFG